MADYKTFLLKLNENLNILQEQAAKYGTMPLGLLNQIADHEQAIALTRHTIKGEISEAEWRDALKPLLVLLPQEARAIFDQRGQHVYGDQYNIAGDLHLHLDDVPSLPEPWRREALAARDGVFPDVDVSKRPKIYLSCHGDDLAVERDALRQTLAKHFQLEIGDAHLPDYELGMRVVNSDALVLVQAAQWAPARTLEYNTARQTDGRVAILIFQKFGNVPLEAETEIFDWQVQDHRQPWHEFKTSNELNGQVLDALLDRMSAWTGKGRVVSLAVLTGVYAAARALTHQAADPLALLNRLATGAGSTPERLGSEGGVMPAINKTTGKATGGVPATSNAAPATGKAHPAPAEVQPHPQAKPSGRIKHHPLKPELVSIPAGPFLMGTDRRELEKAGVRWENWFEGETPQHSLTLPAYAIGKYPVTNAEFAHFIEAGGYSYSGLWTEAGWSWKQRNNRTQPAFWTEAKWNQPTHPVVGVRWYEAVAYCRWLTETTGQVHRLPTEAEWEKAARGPSTGSGQAPSTGSEQGRIYPWGNTWDASRCNNEEQALQQTTPVGRYSPSGDSPYGCADMVGNVWEWCATRRGKKYPYNVKENEWADDYLAGDSARVLRGGSFNNTQRCARCACRRGNPPDWYLGYYGFRLVVSPISPPSAL